MDATNDNQPNAEVDAGSEPDWEARTDSDTNAGSASDLEETDAKKFIEDTPKGDACTETAVDGNYIAASTDLTENFYARLGLKPIMIITGLNSKGVGEYAGCWLICFQKYNKR